MILESNFCNENCCIFSQFNISKSVSIFFNIFGSGLISCGFAIVIAEECVILSFEDIYPISSKTGTKGLQDWVPRIVVPKRFFGEIIL